MAFGELAKAEAAPVARAELRETRKTWVSKNSTAASVIVAENHITPYLTPSETNLRSSYKSPFRALTTSKLPQRHTEPKLIATLQRPPPRLTTPTLGDRADNVESQTRTLGFDTAAPRVRLEKPCYRRFR